jgi:hypothetical protein
MNASSRCSRCTTNEFIISSSAARNTIGRTRRNPDQNQRNIDAPSIFGCRRRLWHFAQMLRFIQVPFMFLGQHRAAVHRDVSGIPREDTGMSFPQTAMICGLMVLGAVIAGSQLASDGNLAQSVASLAHAHERDAGDRGENQIASKAAKAEEEASGEEGEDEAAEESDAADDTEVADADPVDDEGSGDEAASDEEVSGDQASGNEEASGDDESASIALDQPNPGDLGGEEGK